MTVETYVPRRLELVTAPTAPLPVLFADWVDHARPPSIDDQVYAENLIVAAGNVIGRRMRRQLLTATYRVHLDAFASVLLLHRPPLQSVASIKYDDVDGVEQTVATATYVVRSDAEPGYVELAPDQDWPSTNGESGCVRIEYVAGYGDAPADIPEEIRVAILMLATHWYELRVPVLTGQNATRIPESIDAIVYGKKIPAGLDP